ncbi:glycosyltransferase family 9 protein [Chitinophagaceae bacterium MMS25-I14]
MKQSLRNIIISRTDSIGDVILTLPVAKVLKDHFPGIKIGFLGKAYTRAVIEACIYVDEFIDLEDFNAGPVKIAGESPEAILHVFPVADIARKARSYGIPLRIGTTNRLYHWTTCNKLVRLSRKNSDLHEAQLNLKLLTAVGIQQEFSLAEISSFTGLKRVEPLKPEFAALIDSHKYNLILHPKSQGSAREWGLENFVRLAELLDGDKFRIFISGTAKERELLDPLFDAVAGKVTDITGKMSLPQFISFINTCDGLLANSTGPLHIAAALGKDAYGIYPPMRPIHPGRWAPLGPHTEVFVLEKECNDCRKAPSACHCIKEINPLLIKAVLDKKALLKNG